MQGSELSILLQNPKASRQQETSFKNKSENILIGVTQNRGTLGSLYPGLILVGPNSQSNSHTFVCNCLQLHARNVTLSTLLGRFNISHKTCYLRLR